MIEIACDVFSHRMQLLMQSAQYGDTLVDCRAIAYWYALRALCTCMYLLISICKLSLQHNGLHGESTTFRLGKTPSC